MRKKRSLTLLEIMVVIMLIGIIGSVIGFNMKGSIDEGRAFKTRHAMAQIKDVLMLEVAKGRPIAEVVDHAAAIVDQSGMVKGNLRKFMQDGWNHEFSITVNGVTHDDIIIHSDGLDAYNRKKREKGLAQLPDED